MRGWPPPTSPLRGGRGRGIHGEVPDGALLQVLLLPLGHVGLQGQDPLLLLPHEFHEGWGIVFWHAGGLAISMFLRKHEKTASCCRKALRHRPYKLCVRDSPHGAHRATRAGSCVCTLCVCITRTQWALTPGDLGSHLTPTELYRTDTVIPVLQVSKLGF